MYLNYFITPLIDLMLFGNKQHKMYLNIKDEKGLVWCVAGNKQHKMYLN